MVTKSFFESEAYLLHILVSRLNMKADKILKLNLGISFSQFMVLCLLLKNPDLNQKKIACLIHFTEAGVSRHLLKLEELGLLFRYEDPKSKRQNQLSLTQKSQKLIPEAYKLLNQVNDEAFAVLSNEQRVNFTNTLKYLHINSTIVNNFSCLNTHKT